MFEAGFPTGRWAVIALGLGGAREASSGVNRLLERSSSAIAQPLASPPCYRILFWSRHGLRAFPSL
jgi:hypothetical protein